MARVVWAPQAYADLEAIGDFIARVNPRYAQMLANGILRTVDRIALFPHAGRVAPEIGDDSIREVLYRGLRVLYVLSDVEGRDDIELLTVSHSSNSFGGLP